MTVVRHAVRAAITVEFPAGPVPHLLRPGRPAEHDARLQKGRQGHPVVDDVCLDLCEQTTSLSHGGYFRGPSLVRRIGASGITGLAGTPHGGGR